MKQIEAILGDMLFIPLKGVVLILILILTTSQIHAQYALGATGQMMIPTAEMQETGTFMGSANFLAEEVTPHKFNYPTMNYSVDMSLFSFVELTYRMTYSRCERIMAELVIIIKIALILSVSVH